MDDTRIPTDGQAPLLRALTALKAVRAELDALRRAQAEPIAVIGLGCRYPGGVRDAESFWALLREGRDAIGEVPPERWDAAAWHDPDPAAPGKVVTRQGGFLEGIDLFAPEVFGIAPREAASMDPQQRLLLEVAWEALEHAGLAPDALRGSRTGVFVGISSSEYAHLLLAGGPERIDPYMGSGTAHSVAAGRLAFVFGFEGPAIAVDTACSSSLVAVHLACQSLRGGECDLALAGGVNLLLTPMVSIAHSRARMLAPDGRCKAFDAAADGFGRAEGCGLVALRRLSDAEREGDPVLALIRGSAVNQDGHTSGLTVPSGPSQKAVIRRALAVAGLAPAGIGYVEAHGTGTALGDPIELGALAAVFREGRAPGRPLVVGSVKTNLGHAESAAGIAGLIKAVLALRHRSIPANLHFREPNPRLDWAGMPLLVPGTALPWPEGPRLAGVSSFGFSGTNAHVVLAEAPAPAAPEVATAVAERPLHLLALSAPSEATLRELAGRTAAQLAAHPGQDLADLCHSAALGRARLRHRLCVVAGSGVETGERLAAFEAGQGGPGILAGEVAGRPPPIAFLFTGQGAQYPGMARALFETQPEFRRELEACDALLRGEMPRPLLDLLYAPGAGDALDATAHTQPALFAVEYALARLWMSWGVQPDLLLGHSLGEYVAACIAGVLPLEDALRLVAARARLMGALPEGGGMAAIPAGEAEVRAALAALAPELDVAALNGPEAVVVSGPRDGVARMLAQFAARGVEGQALRVSHAFHSALVEPMLGEFARVAAGLRWSPPALDLVSNVTGGLAGAEIATPEYWCRQARQPVRFAAGLRCLAEQGAGIFLEVGPQPVLLGLGRRCLPRLEAAWLPSLRRGAGDWPVLLETLAALHLRGVRVDWRGFDAPYARRRVPLPATPFPRQRYWAAGGAPHPPLAAGREPADRPEPVPQPEPYALRWLPQPRPEPPAITPESILAPLWPRLEAALADPGLLAHAEALAALDAEAPGHVGEALRQLGWPWGVGERCTTEGVRQRLGIAPERAGLLGRLLAILAGAGVLRPEGAGWVVLAALPRRAPAEGGGAAPAERAMLERCGTRLAEVLTGACDPLSLVFPGGDATEAARIYGESPGAAAMHRLLGGAVAGLRGRWPAGRALRVLEIGAGTGGATAAVLPELPPGTEYLCTDISRGFLAEARRRFAAWPGLRTALLDIEGAPEAQGFAAGGFDLVIAFNVLHATRSVRESLAHARRLLAPGGLLLVQETVAPAPWVELIWGLTPGWWRFTDHTLRPDHPLLGTEAWRGLLLESGFDAVAMLGADPARHPVLARQALLLARAAPEVLQAPAEPWLLLADAGGPADALAHRLATAGHRVVLARRGAGFARLGPAEFALDPEAPGDFRRLLAEMQAPPRRVLHLWGLEAPAAEALEGAALLTASVALSAGLVHLVQALATLQRTVFEGEGQSAAAHRVQGSVTPPAPHALRRTAPEARPALWLVTRGAEAAGEAPPALAQATLSGIGRTVAREHPELWGGMLDLDPAMPAEAAAAAILAEVEHPDGEDQLAFRAGCRLAARILPLDLPPDPTPALRADATYLVTGGLGALGLETARWLVERGARHLALLGRGGAASAAARAAVAALGQRAQIRVFAADVADAAALAGVLAEIAAGPAPLRGVVHAAGLPGRSAITALDAAALRRLFAAKVAGGWNLHRLTAGLELDLFLCFSSMVSLWGAREQAHYAAANRFLDALAAHRRALGLPALCVNWGPLSGGGMLPAEGAEELRRIGVAATGLAGAAGCLAPLLGAGVAQAAMVRIDWPLFQAAYQSRGPCRLFDLVATRATGEAAAPPPAAGTTGTILEGLRAAPAAERRARLVAHLQATLGTILGLEAGRLPDRRQGLFDMGLDSLTAMELRTALQASLGVALPPTLAFDHGTIEALADFLLRDRLRLETPAPAAPHVEAEQPGEARRRQIGTMSEADVEALLEAKLLTL